MSQSVQIPTEKSHVYATVPEWSKKNSHHQPHWQQIGKEYIELYRLLSLEFYNKGEDHY